MKLIHKQTGNIVEADDAFYQAMQAEYYIYTEQAPTLDALKRAKIAELHAFFQSQIDDMKKGYASYEVDTWKTQSDEWVSWNKDATTKTPFVDAMASARGIDRIGLLNRIGVKTLAIAQMVGTQQSFEDAINACVTKAELDAIVWG